VNDLATRWRPLNPSEQPRAKALLKDASAMIRARLPGIDKRLAAGSLDRDVPRQVACTMVKRALLTDTEQPAITQQSETMGGFTYQQTLANPTGDLYLAAAEMKALRGPARAGTIDMMPHTGHPGAGGHHDS